MIWIIFTHWGQVTHICIGNLTIIVSDNGLSPYRRQAIIWTNAGILLIGPIGTYFSEILIEILTFSFKKMRLNVSSAKRRPFCLGLNVLTQHTSRYYCSTNLVGRGRGAVARGFFRFDGFVSSRWWRSTSWFVTKLWLWWWWHIAVNVNPTTISSEHICLPHV